MQVNLCFCLLIHPNKESLLIWPLNLQESVTFSVNRAGIHHAHTHAQAESNFVAWQDCSSMWLLPTENEEALLLTPRVSFFFSMEGKKTVDKVMPHRWEAKIRGASMCVWVDIRLTVWVDRCRSYFSWPDASYIPQWDCDSNKKTK